MRTIGEFLEQFILHSGLQTSFEDVMRLTLEKSIDLSYKYDPALGAQYVEELNNCQTMQQVRDLIQSKQQYYTVFMSALIIVLEELTRGMHWEGEQKAAINQLLDSLQLFEEV
jgi:hypothetical protein